MSGQIFLVGEAPEGGYTAKALGDERRDRTGRCTDLRLTHVIFCSGLVAGLGALLGCRATLRTDLVSVRRGIATAETQEVQVRAVLRGRVECLPCPEENGAPVPCQPCVDMVILSEAPAGPAEENVYVEGRGSNLVVGHTYSFRIRLRPGYTEHLHDDSPVDWRIFASMIARCARYRR